MPDEVFKTRFRTERHKPVVVHEADGTSLFSLEPRHIDPATRQIVPAEEHTLETCDPFTTWSRYSEVTFLHEAPWAKVRIRDGWTEPKRKWPCEFLLVQGNTDPDYKPLLNYALCLHHGVPVIVDLDLRDEMIVYDHVSIGIPRTERTPHEEFDGIVSHRIVYDEAKHLRDEKDLERIQRELESLAPAEVEI